MIECKRHVLSAGIVVLCMGFSVNTQAQICDVNVIISKPHSHINNDVFLNTKTDLPFISPQSTNNGDADILYARLFVSADILNVRNTPNGKIIGKRFRGERIFLYAKKGNWVATSPLKSKSQPWHTPPKWIHILYVTKDRPYPISKQKLSDECGVESLVLHLKSRRKTGKCAYVYRYINMAGAFQHYSYVGGLAYRRALIDRLKQEPPSVIKALPPNCFNLNAKRE